jgi:hypothetical protein
MLRRDSSENRLADFLACFASRRAFGLVRKQLNHSFFHLRGEGMAERVNAALLRDARVLLGDREGVLARGRMIKNKKDCITNSIDVGEPEIVPCAGAKNTCETTALLFSLVNQKHQIVLLRIAFFRCL